MEGEVAAAGSGWAAENHADAVNVVGGWGVPADLSISSEGQSVGLDQEGSLTQISTIDSENASAINLASISQIVDAAEGLEIAASGLEISAGQSGWAAAAGQGSIASDAATSLVANSGGH